VELELDPGFAKQALYRWNHTSSPFFSDYFGDGISKTTPVLAVNLNPPDLCLPSSHDYRREPSHQARGPILIPQFTHIRAVESISGVQEAWVGRQRASGPVAKWRSKVQDSFVT
jgi:hypothetical protein